MACEDAHDLLSLSLPPLHHHIIDDADIFLTALRQRSFTVNLLGARAPCTRNAAGASGVEMRRSA